MPTARVAAIILAAGASRRFEQPKLLVRYRGTPMLRRAVEAAADGGCADVLVVLGADRDLYAPVLNSTGARIVSNPLYQEGMSSSIRTGVRALPPQTSAALIMLADQPRIGAGVVRSLLAAYAETRARIIAARYGEVRGAPVLFDRSLFVELLLLEGDQGARAVMETHPHDVIEVVIPAEAGLDVDRPEDAARLQRED